jgi:aspartokinase-like uncharacterized kinase
MSTVPLRIIKLGGSLLIQPDWPQAFTAWIDKQPHMRNIVIVGGGLSADAVRAFDHAHQLDPAVSHKLAIEALGVSLQMAAAVLPQARTISSLEALNNNSASETIELLDVRPFLCGQESHTSGERLPHDWSVTSDSIAARIATVLYATELVLLKSTVPKHCDNWQQATQIGLVDAHFPHAVKNLRNAYCVNLTDPHSTAWRPLNRQET